jgi:hypothetical protein
VKFLFDDWLRAEAWHLFSVARMDWHEQQGWPGMQDAIGLVVETKQMRSQSHPAFPSLSMTL